MSEETKTVEPEVKEEVKQENHEGLDHLSEQDKSKVLKLRKENAERRNENKELKKQLEEIQSTIQKQKEDKLIEDGKLQELLDEKSKELDSLKGVQEENATLKKHFEKQLEAATQKLSKEQQELIEDSGWDIAKKLDWALRFSDKNISLKDSPDSKRPGDDTTKTLDINEYRGPEGRKKLAALRRENPKKYELVMNLKN